jgi:hypothetical protein
MKSLIALALIVCLTVPVLFTVSAHNRATAVGAHGAKKYWHRRKHRRRRRRNPAYSRALRRRQRAAALAGSRPVLVGSSNAHGVKTPGGEAGGAGAGDAFHSAGSADVDAPGASRAPGVEWEEQDEAPGSLLERGVCDGCEVGPPRASRENLASGAAAAPEGAAPVSGRATPGASDKGATTDNGAALSRINQQPLRIPRFHAKPIIDGKLDDPVWGAAAVFRDFHQIRPGDNSKASKQTEALLGYDADNLYIAFRAYDDPGKVMATIARRDEIFDDDNVTVLLDTFNDSRKAYKLSFNPYGIQADSIMVEGGGEDRSIDILMTSKGVVGEDGYTVEVAIPFKSISYVAERGKLWGVHFFRTIKRLDNEMDSWMPISRDVSGTLSQAGHITGIENLPTARTLDLIPTLTFTEQGRRVRSFAPSQPGVGNSFADAGRLLNQPVHAELGLTAKFRLTPTSVIDFALNPDYADVEADQAVIVANQRFPIFFAEKRPFFLEGRDIFQTPLQAVHTRAIVDPDLALKFTGKEGRANFGFLYASDNAPGNFGASERTDPRNSRFLDKNSYIGIARVKYDVGRESSLGGIFTAYKFVDRFNYVGGADGRFRIDPQTTFSFQVLGTTTRGQFYDPESDSNVYRRAQGLGYFWNLNRSGRYFGFNVGGSGRTRDYRADVGFTRRTDTNAENFSAYYTSEPKPKATLISWNVYNSSSINFDWRARTQGWSNYSGLGLSLKHQTYLSLSFERGYERLFEEEFGPKRTASQPGTFFGNDPERSAGRRGIYLSGGTTPNAKYGFYSSLGYTSGGFDYDYGAGPRYPRVSPAALADPNATIDPGPGKSLDASFSFLFRPVESLSTSFDYVKSRFTRNDTGLTAYDDNIFSARVTYQFSRSIFARAKVDYGTLYSYANGQYLVGWTPRPGTSVYLGYNDNQSYNGYSPFTGQFEPGFRRNGRTAFLKISYLFRHDIPK